MYLFHRNTVRSAQNCHPDCFAVFLQPADKACRTIHCICMYWGLLPVEAEAPQPPCRIAAAMVTVVL